MSENLTLIWLQDDTIRIQATIRDFDDTLVDPDSHQIIIYNPLAVAMGTYTGPSRVSLGIFTQDYAIPSAGPSGDWKISWRATFGAFNSREIGYFKVAEG